jgi:hypothetical protein
MALSRSMKNLMHQSAIARGGGGNPTGGGRSGFIGRAMQQAKSRGQYNPGGNRGRMPGGNRGPRGPGGRVGGRNPRTGGPGGPVLRPSPGGTPPTGGRGGIAEKIMAKRQQALQRGGGMAQIAVPGGRMPRGGVMGGPAGGAGKPMPGGGTFGFAGRGGGGTPALQQATAGARSQAMRQAAAPRPAGAVPGGVAGAAGRARAAGPAALAKPRGQSVASRIGGQQGPPARRGGMARALGSGGSRRRMLR